jgi:serine protease Do
MTSFMRSVVVLFTISLAGAGFAQGASDARGLSLSFREAVKKVKPAVVYIECTVTVNEGYYATPGKASGSGVIIDAKKGYVLTAAHVIDEASEITVRLEDGRKFTAKQKWTDTASDVGLLQIEGENLPEARLGDSDQMEVGDWVLAIGSPFGRAFENSVSAGIVSAKGRRTRVLGTMGVEDFIQTDAAINRGNSGGPLVNIDGEVVGINSNIISSSGMNAGLGFAVPSKMAKMAIEQLVKGGRVARGFMGVDLLDMKDLEEERPAAAAKIAQWIKDRGAIYVRQVTPGEPAAEAGLKAGDVILALDAQKMTSAGDLIEYISMKKPGEEVACSIWRDGKTLTLKATLTERPSREQAKAAEGRDTTDASFSSIGIMGSDRVGAILDSGVVSRIRGVMVDFVKPGSPAEKAGIQTGDLIMTVNGAKSRDSRAFERLLAAGDLRKGVTMTIINGNGEKEVVVKK